MASTWSVGALSSISEARCPAPGYVRRRTTCRSGPESHPMRPWLLAHDRVAASQVMKALKHILKCLLKGLESFILGALKAKMTHALL